MIKPLHQLQGLRSEERLNILPSQAQSAIQGSFTTLFGAFLAITKNNKKLSGFYIILKCNNTSVLFSELKIYTQKRTFIMDTRLLVIAVPLLFAASWALYNIGRLAIQQVQRLSR